MQSKIRIAVIGAGLGGLTVGAALQQRGYNVTIFEQAPAFARLGAGIAVASNVMRVMRHIGLEERLLQVGLSPRSWVSREWNTGRVMFELPLASRAEVVFGAPYLM